MHFKLGLSGPKARSFTDYFSATIRDVMSEFSGSFSLKKDGSSVNTVTGAIPIKGGQQVLSWSFIKAPNGTLEALEVVEPPDAKDEGPWTDEVSRIVTSALTGTLSERVQRFFRRHLLLYVGRQLDGEYWLPGMRVAPAWQDDLDPLVSNAERVLAIDTEFDAIDEMHANAVSQEMTRRNAARLSLLLDVGLYEPQPYLIWVVDTDPATGAISSTRRHPGFTRPDVNITRMPEKTEICPPGRYAGSLQAKYKVAGQHLSFPPETRRILRGVDSQGPSVFDTFDRCARLYHFALVIGAQFPSVALAYRVAAIEAIVQGNPQFKSFSDFVRKNVQPKADLDADLEAIYGRGRSAHFHGGHFPLGEYDRPLFWDPIMDDSDIRKWEFSLNAQLLIRESIVSWLVSVIPEK